MSSLSFLRCMTLVLFMGATAEAQSPVDDGVPQPPETLPFTGHHMVDNGAPVFERDWLGLSTRPPRYTTWISAEYVWMWLNGAAAPPLITSSASGVPIGIAA